MFRNNCICVPRDVSAHVTMEAEERKAIQCPRPGLFTQGDLLVQDNASLHTALLYTRYWERIPVQPLELSSIWKITENYLLGQQFPSDNTIRDEIEKRVWEQAQKISSYAIASAWTSLVTLWTRKGLVLTHNNVLQAPLAYRKIGKLSSWLPSLYEFRW